MTMDREKVINGLRSIKTYLASQAIETTDSFAREGFIESQKDIDDAVALLKEQEPVEPKEIINDFYPVEDYRRTLGWRCGKCGRNLMGDGDFCSYCGQAVKWE